MPGCLKYFVGGCLGVGENVGPVYVNAARVNPCLERVILKGLSGEI
jgi:hypothetical protein